ncbi:hypothetical protein ACFQOY_10045 [Enterococcus alcedinis]|uniref:hypothetical protein n=1 Tax=Enterococcus alcedinis TaxID=1274384 RepID=UPI00361C31F3
MFWMIVIPFVLITMTLAMLVHSILEKYYALLFTDKTDYTFKCSACQTEYQLSGDEVKKHIHPKWLFLTKKKSIALRVQTARRKLYKKKGKRPTIKKTENKTIANGGWAYFRVIF